MLILDKLLSDASKDEPQKKKNEGEKKNHLNDSVISDDDEIEWENYQSHSTMLNFIPMNL